MDQTQADQTQADRTQTAAAADSADGIAARLDALTDLFRRRLVADQNAKAAAAVLHEQLDRSAALVESAFVLPLARRLFGVIDRMDSAAGSGGAAGTDGELAASVAEELVDILAGHGIEEIRVEGDRFDPAVQNALTAVATYRRDRDGTVAERVGRGWRLGPRILRPQLVEVYRWSEPGAERMAGDRG